MDERTNGSNVEQSIIKGEKKAGSQKEKIKGKVKESTKEVVDDGVEVVKDGVWTIKDLFHDALRWLSDHGIDLGE
ncbi:MAG: hypothetical protein K6G03_12680 [Lachnospiraceae bacterium]|nr:hypothetical protein [Lachnospiraceae bacterium]